MVDHLLIQYHNIAEGQESSYGKWLDSILMPKLRSAGFHKLEWYRLSAIQINPDYSQPFSYAALYEFSGDPVISAKLFAEQGRAEAKRAGYILDDRSHLFDYVTDVIPSGQSAEPGSSEYLQLVMGNYVPSMEEEYRRYYDDIHGPEVLGVPGFVSLRRGRLSDIQAEPQNDQPANAIIVERIFSSNVQSVFDEFRARYFGTSPAGIHWQDRSPSAAPSTTHIFTPIFKI